MHPRVIKRKNLIRDWEYGDVASSYVVNRNCELIRIKNTFNTYIVKDSIVI
jgi:hypothetical protein